MKGMKRLELTEFTKGASGNEPRCFVASSELYLDKSTFLEAAWKEFYLHEAFEKPNAEIVEKGYARFFDEDEDTATSSDIERGYCFADEKKEPGAFRIYILDEKILKPLKFI